MKPLTISSPFSESFRGSWRPATSLRAESPDEACEDAHDSAAAELEEEEHAQEDSEEAAAADMEEIGEAATEVIKVRASDHCADCDSNPVAQWPTWVAAR